MAALSIVVALPLVVFLQTCATTTTATTVLPQNCSRSDLEVIDTADLQPVLAITKEGTNYKEYESYLQREEGFQGVSVEIEGIVMFFTALDRCFPKDYLQVQWWTLDLLCYYYSWRGMIGCSLRLGKCSWVCEKHHISQRGVPSPHVLTHGPSRWRSTPPPNTCVVQDFLWVAPYKDRICRDRPISQDPSANTTSTVLPQDCSRSDLMVENTANLQPALTTSGRGLNFRNQESYLQRKEGFEGVSVEVEGIDMFFAAQDHCFPGDDDTWWRVDLQCYYFSHTQRIGCDMRAGKCFWECEKYHIQRHAYPRHHWVGHGPARWRSTHPPHGCRLRGWHTREQHKYTICTDLPGTHRPFGTTTNTTSTDDTATTTTSTDDTTTIKTYPPWLIAVVVVSGLVLSLVVLVMVVR